ncbi:transmembrane emp24 domain-containing protein 1a [Cynoglossus semilaevis]|uniref:Transmembrane p24 trafficking protein 1a n=1 Tax=Cynoglossus semilaevis TaxID=244447 RepID=A0A3P8VPH3_CYNSE|nr:transmembrane emp24 domain-containing protein 1 [Cynoglossus semilaevis]
MHCGRTTMDVSELLCLMTLSALTVVVTSASGAYQDVSLTFLLPAGRTECFYQTTTKSDGMDIEYQVIAGYGLDVGFTLISPSGHRLYSDFRSSDGVHVVAFTEDGDYKLCFDNSYSKVSEKIIYFELVIRSNSPSSRAGGLDGVATMTDSVMEYKLEDIRMKMDSVNQHLEKSRQILGVLRAFEARDRYLLENNLWRVSFWSCVNLLVMLTVAAAQIYTLRRLFENNTGTRT